MVRFATLLLISAGLTSGALAQLTETPGPGGTRIAPGAAPYGYTPGGIGLSGSKIAPGPGAADLPMYRRAPGGERVLVTPHRGEERRQSLGGGGAGGVAAHAAPCRRQSCLPEGLQLTIDSNIAPEQTPGTAIDSMQALRAALRACWSPPAEQRQDEVHMSVRFSFRRSGELIGSPFVTYTTPGVTAQIKQDYRRSITAALDRCAPFKFSPRFASGIAGRPLSVRFVDHRKREGGAR